MPYKVESLLRGKDLEKFLELTSEQKAEVEAAYEEEVLEKVRPVRMLLGLADEIADTILASGILKKAAQIQRSYYLALLDQGFTHEQAMALTTASSSLLSAFKKPD